MYMKIFNPGDKVVCIDNTYDYRVELFKIYTVKSTRDSIIKGLSVICIDESYDSYDSFLFISVKEYRSMKLKKLKDDNYSIDK